MFVRCLQYWKFRLPVSSEPVDMTEFNMLQNMASNRRISKVFSRFLICAISCYAFILISGCTGFVIGTNASSVREITDRAKLAISPGDHRSEVHNILGEPIIDINKLGIEVYRSDGRDIDLYLTVPIPLLVPMPGDDVTLIVLARYDKNDLVKRIKMDVWASKYKKSGEPFVVTLDGFKFFYVLSYMPETLLGPAMTLGELEASAINDDACALIVLLGDSPIGQVSLNGRMILDFSNVFSYCDPFRKQCFIHDRNDDVMFVSKIVEPGGHELSITSFDNNSFSTRFECSRGSVIYAELEVNDIVEMADNDIDEGRYGSFVRLEGLIAIGNRPSAGPAETNAFRQMLWHDGDYYGFLGNPDVSENTDNSDR